MEAYLDHAATTALRPEAREAMLEWLGPRHGNPSGAHHVARAARRAVDDARDQIAECLGCAPGEIVFCSGGTEADNLAVTGVVGRNQMRAGADGGADPVAVCSAFEHHAVLDAVIAAGGTTAAVGPDGVVTATAVTQAMGPSTALVSLMAVNNEVGTVQPLTEVARAVRRVAPDVVVHTDAVQAVPWLDVATHCAEADLVSISAHKFGGPQGVGVLVVRSSVTELAPLLLGGGQERGRRSGTHNVAGIVGAAAALQATTRQRTVEVEATARRRDRLVDAVVARVDGVAETAPRSTRVAGNAHLLIEGVTSDGLLFLLDRAGVSASAASSCASGAQQASHVLAAMGVGADRAALRLTLGPTTTDAEVDHAVEVLVAAIDQLRT